VLGLGVQFVDIDADKQRIIDEFVRSFRYTVLLMAEGPRRAALERALQDEYRILAASSLEQAIALSESADAAVIVVDWRVGDHTAVDLLGHYNERLPGSQTARIGVAGLTPAPHTL